MPTRVTGGDKPPTKFQVRREKTRADLLTLGIARFPLKGYAATSIEDIVRDSGYTRGAFYFHFASKEAFFLDVLRSRKDVRGPWWERVEAAQPHDLATTLVTAQAEFAQAEPDGGRWTTVIAEFVEANRDDEALMEPLRDLHRAWAGELAWLMRFAQDRGWCRTDHSAEELAEDVLAVTTGFGVMHDTYGTIPARLMDVYLRYLAPR